MINVHQAGDNMLNYSSAKYQINITTRQYSATVTNKVDISQLL